MWPSPKGPVQGMKIWMKATTTSLSRPSHQISTTPLKKIVYIVGEGLVFNLESNIEFMMKDPWKGDLDPKFLESDPNINPP